jgi:hypothetical protein
LWVCQRILFRVTADKAGFDAQFLVPTRTAFNQLRMLHPPPALIQLTMLMVQTI